MPIFMDDPSVLTKERLKSELLANNVELPGGNPSRDVYVQLYVKTLSAQSHGTDTALDAFSSDEDLPSPVVSRKSRSSGRKSEAAWPEQLDVALLTDDALREQLLAHGVYAGPIVASTRKLYENKLRKLQDKGAVASEPQKNHNCSGDSEVYSDQEDELTADPDPEQVPKLKEGMRSRKNNTSQRPNSTRHNAVMAPLDPPTFISNYDISPKKRPSESEQERVSSAATEKVQKGEQLERIRTEVPPEEDSAVPELSLAGLTAACRRPIKGAAGRPVILANHNQSAHTEINFSSSALTGVSPAPSTTGNTNPALINGRSAPSSANPFLPDASAAPNSPYASQAKAQGGMSWWKKLILWAVLAGFLFLIYQAMEINSASPFAEIQEL